MQTTFFDIYAKYLIKVIKLTQMKKNIKHVD